jgi:hypothetical protein
MAAQSKMGTKTGFLSESYILMVKWKIFSGLFTLTNYLAFMKEFFSQYLKMAPKFNMAFFLFFFVQFSTSWHSGVKLSNSYFLAYSWRIQFEKSQIQFLSHFEFFGLASFFSNLILQEYGKKIRVWKFCSADTTRGKLYKNKIKKKRHTEFRCHFKILRKKFFQKS